MGFATTMYCDKCGKIWIIFPPHTDSSTTCDICKNTIKKVPDNYFENLSNEGFLLSKDMEQKLINDLVLTSPNFDQYYFEHKDGIKGQQDRELSAKMAHGKAILEGRDKGTPYEVTCPYCHSTNVKKITITSKAVHTAVFGIFSIGRNSKQWRCENCDSEF